MNATSPHSFKHSIVRSLSDPGSPVLDSDAEVQELVLSNSGESDDTTTQGHHEAVDSGCSDFLFPSLGDQIAGKGVCVLWKHLREANDCACLLSIENARHIHARHLAQKYRRIGSRHSRSLRAGHDRCPLMGRGTRNQRQFRTFLPGLCGAGSRLNFVSLEAVRHETLGTLDRLAWQARDVVDLLVRPTWGTEKHGYDRILYGVVMNAMSVADRLSFYRAPGAHQTKRLRALVSEMGADSEAAAVTVHLWRHTLIHTGDPLPFTDTGTGVKYQWLLHWGEEHLPRKQHLTFTNGPGVRILAFGALHAVADLHEAAERLLTAAEGDDELAEALVAARAGLLQKQSRDLAF